MNGCCVYTHFIYAEILLLQKIIIFHPHTFCWNIRKTLNFQFGFNFFLFGIAWLTPNCDETVDMQPFHEFLKYLNVRHCQWTELFKKGPISKLKLQQYIDFTVGQISQTFTFYSTAQKLCHVYRGPRYDCTFPCTQKNHYWHMQVKYIRRIIKFSALITFGVFLCANNSHCRCMGEGAWKKDIKTTSRVTLPNGTKKVRLLKMLCPLLRIIMFYGQNIWEICLAFNTNTHIVSKQTILFLTKKYLVLQHDLIILWLVSIFKAQTLRSSRPTSSSASRHL